jgi:integrase
VIAKQSGPAAADKARADLSALFTWAMREGLVEANPVIATNTATENKARDRVLTNSELTGIWRALGEDHYSSIVRLLILTGQRRDEIAALRWSEVNTAKRLICFEGARTKNSLPHDVPLSDATLAIIEAQPIRAGREHVFGEGKGGFQGFSKCKATLDAKLGAAVPPWRLHDLRRSAATGMAELGVLPHVVEAVLNHISGHKKGVAGTYNRAVYANEKRIALDMWGQHVMRLVEGREAKVVAFPGKRA